MRMNNAMIACNTNGPIEVGPWPDRTGSSKPYRLKFGACEAEWRTLSPRLQVARLFIDFQQTVIKHGIPPADAHREFLKIDEYRWHIGPDAPGAEPMPKEWERKVIDE